MIDYYIPMFKSLLWRLHFFFIYARKFGLVSSFALSWKLYANIIRIRMSTTDTNVFNEVFLEKAYDLGFLNLHPSTIIDGGANVGYTSIFFSITYPQAKIFAIEPEGSNFAMLLKNVKYYRNIIPINAALWPIEDELEILDTGAGKWAFQTVKSTKKKQKRLMFYLLTD
jgi:hypothetical protein